MNRKLITRALICALLLCLTHQAAKAQSAFTGTWATAAEWTGKGDMPHMSLSGNTLREIIQVSIGGGQLQLQLSNEFGNVPVNIKEVYVADALDSCDINRKTAVTLTFGGQRAVTIEPGNTTMSDTFKYNLKPLQRLSITICYGDATPEHMTSHRGSRTTSFIALGQVSAKKKFVAAEKLDHWYNITQLNVLTDGKVKAVAVLGNSITDGRGSTTNMQNRWPDQMAKELLTATSPLPIQLGVLNLGIGGNCVIRGGISEPALKRFDRDILGQQGVERLIIFEGTNDIGGTNHSEQTARELIEAYKTLIRKAHDAGIKTVYGATITPCRGFSYFTPYHEAARQEVNKWIRESGTFDAVIDFDALTRDPQQPDRLKAEFSDDWLHLNAEGYRAMGVFAAEILSK